MGEIDARREGAHVPGTISWAEHLETWKADDAKWCCGQSAERIADRGGFSYREGNFLGVR